MSLFVWESVRNHVIVIDRIFDEHTLLHLLNITIHMIIKSIVPSQ